MGLLQLVLFCGFIAGVLAGSKYDSNVYIDSIVSTVLPTNARSLGLDSVDVPSYAFIVKSTSLTNWDLHVEFHGGKLVGLVSPGLVRWGDCSAPGWQGFNVTLGCYLSLDNLHLSYVGSAKGDSVLNTNKTLSLNVVPVKSSAFIEVTSGSGGIPSLRTWLIRPLNFSVGVTKPLTLNDQRKTAFQSEIAKHSQAALLNVLLVRFKEAVERSVRSVKMPKP
ncbi:uncharacterized protein LOC115312287 [Ixodes scapularis]|uniref:uncharacterized protein LOC115312287 n=1 Tax=Ixodes scapularis TaxID=6945 RepID=UPI001A9CC224|nr:uncharacterized protein LOC115312287 [Ixodes scapularis]